LQDADGVPPAEPGSWRAEGRGGPAQGQECQRPKSGARKHGGREKKTRKFDQRSMLRVSEKCYKTYGSLCYKIRKFVLL
jgi:hypothetical protein